MKNYILIGIAALIIVIVVVLVATSSKKPETTNTTPAASLPATSPSAATLPQKVNVPVPQPEATSSRPAMLAIPAGDGVIEVRDVTRDPLKFEEGIYEFEKTEDYALSFDQNDNSFRLTLWNSDFEKARQLAEQKFLDDLQIDEGEACKLTAHEIVDIPGHPLNRQEMPLSFCGFKL